MTVLCQNCGSLDIETNAAEGNAFCLNCGTVLEENAIVSEVTFAESSNGASVLQGQFVSAEKGFRPMGNSSLSGRRMNPNESREITIASGKRRIHALATAVRLSEKFVDMAHRWFVLALQQNFTQGRKSNNVAAACLYVVCRQEKTPHMLLDFAEILRVNVYSLGNTFLKLCRLLNLELPLLDPSLFIGRFASKLNLGDETRSVANTALRLVSRMKRDWIQTGRRPSGICGAALLISCKMYGHEKTRLEIMRVVRICDATLKKRLDEFSKTDTAALSMEDFKSGVWLETEADPPSFTAAKEAGSNQNDSKKRKRQGSSDNYVLGELESLIKTIDENDIEAVDGKDDSEVELDDVEDDAEDDVEDDVEVNVKDDVEVNIKDNHYMNTNSKDDEKENILVQVSDVKIEQVASDDLIQENTPIETFSDLEEDSEIGCSLLAPHEVEIKTKIWTQLNADYLEYLKKHPNGKSRPRSSKKKKTLTVLPVSSNPLEGTPLAESALDAAKKMIQHRKFSKRINHDVLQMLFDSGKDTEKDTDKKQEITPIKTEKDDFTDSGFALAVVEKELQPEEVENPQSEEEDLALDSEAESLSSVDRYRRQRITTFDDTYDFEYDE